jgi:hypothetical protein
LAKRLQTIRKSVEPIYKKFLEEDIQEYKEMQKQNQGGGERDTSQHQSDQPSESSASSENGEHESEQRQTENTGETQA